MLEMLDMLSYFFGLNRGKMRPAVFLFVWWVG